MCVWCLTYHPPRVPHTTVTTGGVCTRCGTRAAYLTVPDSTKRDDE